MILATWDCNRGPLLRKLSYLADLNADVIVVPELPQIPPNEGLWVGKNPHMGIAIIPKRTTTLEQITVIPDLPENVIFAKVSGSISFSLLAAWTKKKPDEDTGVRGLHRALDLCEKLMPSDRTVIMGNFVSNTIWDNQHPLGRNHSALVKRLDNLGLVSAYHSYFGEKHGQEKQPTFYLSKKEEWPSHIDYCFVPKTWTVTDVTIGLFEDWRDRSAHMPLVVTVDERALSTIS